MKVFNTALFLLALLMAIMAGLPLLGLDLVLIGKGELVEVSISNASKNKAVLKAFTTPSLLLRLLNIFF